MLPMTYEDTLTACAIMRAYLTDDKAGLATLLTDSDPGALLSATVAITAGLLAPNREAIPAAVAALDNITNHLITTITREDSTDE